MLIYETGKGKHIEATAREIARIARLTGHKVKTDFNEITLTATEATDPETIMAAYEIELKKRHKNRQHPL